MVEVVAVAVSLEPQVVQVEAAAALALLVPLVQEMMPLVLVGVQPFKAQLLETALEDGVVQAAAIARLTGQQPRQVIWLNMAEVAAVLLMARLVLTQHMGPEAFLEPEAAAAEVEKVVRLVAQVVFGASMMPQLMAETLVPQAEEVQVA
tara:strand:+ start:555 stop:1001 length:447 start_codon:yes stop_codon:yes gene_type:complete